MFFVIKLTFKFYVFDLSYSLVSFYHISCYLLLISLFIYFAYSDLKSVICCGLEYLKVLAFWFPFFWLREFFSCSMSLSPYLPHHRSRHVTQLLSGHENWVKNEPFPD